MAAKWVIHRNDREMATVLCHHSSGTKAWFDVYNHVAEHGFRHYPNDPFWALVAMIQEGLRPYRIDGDMSQIEAPLKALAS